MEIVLSNVKKEYDLGKTRVEALKGVNFKVQAQDFITVAGPSGSGKTTLLNMLGCLDSPDSGEILFDGVSVKTLDLNARAMLRNEKIGYIFQSFNLMPVLNVYENIELPARIGQRKQDKNQLRDWIMHLIKTVGLDERVTHRPDELSGGQRQRVAIARALVNKPQLVLADEPTANLDADTAQKILELLRKLNREEQTTLVFSTHDQEIIDQCDRVVRMKSGQIISN
ncbi:ABC transporter ATP-binding protein [Massilia sp. W12]|uniref:ABC transporter ATP-binding protein n=1 Tax=Massilia sp. W12 TaxID=3126507 RepID=UPI0030D44DA5